MAFSTFLTFLIFSASLAEFHHHRTYASSADDATQKDELHSYSPYIIPSRQHLPIRRAIHCLVEMASIINSPAMVGMDTP